MKALLISAAMITILSSFPTDILTGRWQSPVSEKGNVTGILFRADNSFEGYVNKKPFVTGTYTVEGDSVFSFVDNGCDGKRGIYKIILFSNGDSLRFAPLTDSCLERKNGMSRLVVGRIK